MLVDEVADGSGKLGVLQGDFPLPLEHDRIGQAERSGFDAICLGISATYDQNLQVGPLEVNLLEPRGQLITGAANRAPERCRAGEGLS